MKQLTVSILALTIAAILCSCSHNPAIFTVGKRTNIGFDPGQLAANISWTDGLNIVDVPRENSSWELEVDESMGLAFDPATNSLSGVRKITRKTGVQVTGYLVDLAKYAPAAALAYIEQAGELQRGEAVKLSPHLVTLPLPQSNGLGINKLAYAELKAQAEADSTEAVPAVFGDMSLDAYKLLLAAYQDCPECLALTPEEEAALKAASGK